MLLLIAGAGVALGQERAVFTESARFERLSHFKDAGLVNELNSVDEAMIADGTYRMFKKDGSHDFEDGYALWKNREATEMVNNETKSLPKTQGPSHFVLTAHKELPEVFPTENPSDDGGYSCKGGKHALEDMTNSMYNWHRALCAEEDDAAWNGVFDPAYMPQQMALTTGFMCIVACDCNERPSMSGRALRHFGSSPMEAKKARDSLCQLLPWGQVDFHQAGDTDELAIFAKPLIDNGPCNGCPIQK